MKTQGLLKQKYQNFLQGSQNSTHNQKEELRNPEVTNEVQKLCEEIFTKYNSTTRQLIGENLLGKLLLSTFFQQFDIFVHVFCEVFFFIF